MSSGRGELAGRVALVTGAAGDLGSAFSRALAAAGADVAVHHLREAERAHALASELAAAGGRTTVVEADVSRGDRVRAMVDAAERELGAVDILVNNAGVMDELPFLETTLEDWERTIAVDLTGVFLCTRAVAAGMVERGRGAIVNVASQLAFKGAPNVAAYCAAKAGVVGFTRALARELGPAVRVNAVAPGPIETAMTGRFADAAWRAERTAGSVGGRLGVPDEVAPAVVFLASEAGAWFHGQTLHVNGGGVMAG